MLETGFLLAVFFKVCIAVLVVVSASLVAQRVSPFLSAMIATLPISAGPNILFLAYDHGSDYLSASMVGSIVAMAATGLYFIGYALVAQRFGYWLSIAAALAGWSFFLLVFDVAGWTMTQAWLAVAIVYATGIPLTKPLRAVPAPAVRPRVWYDVPLRVIGVGAFTALLAWLSHRVGSALAGYVAAFPVVFTSLTFILHHTVGGKVTAAVVANSFWGMIGFAVAQTFVHFTAVGLGWPMALLFGLGICVIWNLGLILIRRRAV